MFHLQQTASATSISTTSNSVKDLTIGNTKSTHPWRATTLARNDPVPNSARFHQCHNLLSFVEPTRTMDSFMRQKWVPWKLVSFDTISGIILWLIACFPIALGLSSMYRWRVSRKCEHLLVQVHLLGLVGEDEINEASSEKEFWAKHEKKKILKKPGWYRRKQHQITPTQRRAYTRLMPSLGLNPHYDTNGPKPLDFQQQFGLTYQPQRITLDVGCGHGHSLVAMAQANTQGCIIGVEWHKASVAVCLQKIDDLALSNCRMVYMELSRFIPHLPDQCLSDISILFPDPWHNTVDEERRVVRTGVMKALTPKAKPGCLLRIVTDVDNYAEWVRQTMAMVAQDWMAAEMDLEPRSFITLYEQKALDEGRPIHELCYVRR